MKAIKMKKVLIALDYNPTAQKVAEVGYALAKGMGANVTLIHVIAEPVYYSSTDYSPIMGFSGFVSMNNMQSDNLDELERLALEFLDKTKHHLKDETIKTIVKGGDFAESIINVAKEVHADFIVMGSHSRKWLEKILMGSVTEEVLHKSSIPLFIIPTKKAE
jgi:nucleotide-binding universal stress UspA family protein